MSDATCPACAGDNLTDYPVCDGCATVHHFPYRATCLHCERKRATTMQREEITALLTELVEAGANDDPRKDATGDLRALRGAQARIRLHLLAERAAALLATMGGTK